MSEWVIPPGYGDMGAGVDPACNALHERRKVALKEMWRQRLFSHERRSFELLAKELHKKERACELHAKRTAGVKVAPHPRHPLPPALRPRPAVMPPMRPPPHRPPPLPGTHLQLPGPPPRFRSSEPGEDPDAPAASDAPQMDRGTPEAAAIALGASQPWYENPLLLVGGLALGGYALYRASKKHKKAA